MRYLISVWVVFLWRPQEQAWSSVSLSVELSGYFPPLDLRKWVARVSELMGGVSQLTRPRLVSIYLVINASGDLFAYRR